MNRTFAIAGGLFVLVVVGLGAALYTGAGPAPGSDTSSDIDAFPTQTDATPGGSGTAAAAETAPFSFAIDDIEDCGTTCRDVTATLTNNQNEAATGVTVYSRLFAGENTTATDDRVWEGTDEAGTIEAGSAYTSTKRVELSFQDARAVEQEDGWITILTTIESDDTTVTFVNSEQMG